MKPYYFEVKTISEIKQDLIDLKNEVIRYERSKQLADDRFTNSLYNYPKDDKLHKDLANRCHEIQKNIEFDKSIIKKIEKYFTENEIN